MFERKRDSMKVILTSWAVVMGVFLLLAVIGGIIIKVLP